MAAMAHKRICFPGTRSRRAATSIGSSWCAIISPIARLVQYLEVMRAHGRDDYPVRAMWNALLAGSVFQHESPESLLRELRATPILMDACGFDPLPIQRKPKPRVVTAPETGVSRIELRARRARRTRELEPLAVRGQRHRTGRDAGDDQRDDGAPARAADGGAARLRRHLGFDGTDIASHSTGQEAGTSSETSDPDADWGHHEIPSSTCCRWQPKRRSLFRPIAAAGAA